MFYFQSSVFKQFTDNDILINYKMFCFVHCLAGLCDTSLYINICQCGCNIFSFKCC